MTKRYYFPLLFLSPKSDWEAIDEPPFRIARRLWETSTFDLATLATRHKLHLPYQVMDVMLGRCNVEVRIETEDLDGAIELLHTLLLGLYMEGVSPTLAPFSTTHSVNEYSGINSRDSESLRGQLSEGLRHGLTSNSSMLEAWPLHLSFSCHALSDRLGLSAEVFRTAARSACRWMRVEEKSATLSVVRDAAQSAPLLSSQDQSLLHIWCAIEALFPRVSTEVSFRLALYLTQLVGSDQRSEYFRTVQKAYQLRSQVAHGSKRGVSADDWSQAWEILMKAAKSVLRRGELPEEKDLLEELLIAGHPCAAYTDQNLS